MTPHQAGKMSEVVAAARNSVARGEHRFVDSTCSLRSAWFPVDTHSGFEEQLLSDHGVLHSKNPIAIEFNEEVNALIGAIASHSDTRSLQQVEAEEGKEAMLQAAEERMGRRPMALALWDMHGAPVRLRGDWVFRVVSPRDVMGDPIIRSYPAHRYVAEVSVKTAELTQQLRAAGNSLARWRTTAVVLLLVLLMVLWLWAR